MSKFKQGNGQPERSDKLLATSYFVNEKIRASQMQVIGADGENFGVISKFEALRAAQDAGLDLVQVGEKDNVIIAKIMDFGKFLYAKKKQLGDAKKKQKIIQIKEVKLRPNIDDNDYNTKLRKAVEFLKDGKKVKFTLQFRGREFIMIKELGARLFERINKDLTDQQIGTLLEEKEQKAGPFWSKIYFLK
ncbi:translation initiation factor IF-3 [Candidatus Dependentiae bacterium]|nr:translation initiation factor IF-3 [Candidatus Dependentiae bacterium]MBU4387068.1 translation initiation factor IF-3 [Candidatus Dependentiae bacterium]MCG2756220.1 translation initiation factor IF-3 [Candidatus Dependentiae bacterium]